MGEPATGGGRLDVLDVLRGAALLLMILVHVYSASDTLEPGRADLWYGQFLYWFVMERGYALFAFLFGAGFALQFAKVRPPSERFLPRYVRRLVALWVLGLFMVTFLRNDILVLYAVSGVMLLPFRRASLRVLLLAAVISAMTPSVEQVARGVARTARAEGESAVVQVEREQDRRSAVEERRERDAVMAEGSYLEVARAQFGRAMEWHTQLWFYLPGPTLALLLMGVLAVRIGVLTDPNGHRGLVLAAMAVGLSLWGAAWALETWSPTLQPEYLDVALVQQGMGVVSRRMLMFSYLGALLLVHARHGASWLFAPLRWAGRMPLTNFVLERAIIVGVFSRFGLGVRYDALESAAVAGVLLAALAAGSWLWLRHFRSGPLEWLWRVATDLRTASAHPGPLAAGTSVR